MHSMKRKIKFHFYDYNQFGALLIKARLATKFAHTAIEFENGFIYHSLIWKGNIKVPKGSLSPAAVTVPVEVDHQKYEAALEFAESIVGQDYDVKALLGFILGKKIQDANARFCSEYGREIFEVATGIRLKYYNLVSPGQLLLIVDTYRNTLKAKG